MNNMLKAGLLSVGTVFFWGLLNVGLRFWSSNTAAIRWRLPAPMPCFARWL